MLKTLFLVLGLCLGPVLLVLVVVLGVVALVVLVLVALLLVLQGIWGNLRRLKATKKTAPNK